MKLVVSVYGMCLCVLDKRQGSRAAGATVLLLNGAAPRTRTMTDGSIRPSLPYHHPLLFVPARHADVARTTWSPVPAPESLVDTENLMSGRHFAWSLSGLDLTLGRGKGLALYENQQVDASGRLPDPSSNDDTKAYLDWRRIPDLSRIVPGARVRSSFRKIGMNVLGLLAFTGGQLRGAKPKNVGGNATRWRFSDSFEQVVTDRFEIHCELPGNSLRATGFSGGRAQTIRLAAADDRVIRLVVVHEASPLASRPQMRAAGTAAAGAGLPHYTAFYEALHGKGVDALAPPRPVGRGGGGGGGPIPVIDTPNCPPALI